MGWGIDGCTRARDLIEDILPVEFDNCLNQTTCSKKHLHTPCTAVYKTLSQNGGQRKPRNPAHCVHVCTLVSSRVSPKLAALIQAEWFPGALVSKSDGPHSNHLLTSQPWVNSLPQFIH